MSELPHGEDGISKWCHDAFEIKDNRLDQHEKENTFGEDLYIPIPRPLGPLIIVISWALTLLVSAWWLLRPVLTTWKGVAWLGGVLLVVMMCIQVLIMFSQSERGSGPAARAKQRTTVSVGNDRKTD
jgi:lysophosphatidic acid acyltransferase/lysophosphatidylinositol acyltransferase